MSQPGPAPEALEETLQAFRRVMTGIRGRWQAALARHGLTFPQWILLKSLHHQGRMTVGELANACGFTAANATGVLDRLERDRLVTRSRSGEDRRVVYVRLTETGREKVEEVVGSGHDAMRSLFEGWDEEELARLREALGRIRLRPEEESGF